MIISKLEKKLVIKGYKKIYDNDQIPTAIAFDREAQKLLIYDVNNTIIGFLFHDLDGLDNANGYTCFYDFRFFTKTSKYDH